MTDALRAAFASLYNSESLPGLDLFLDLGKELHAARLDDFIYDAIDNYPAAAAGTRQLLFAATRLHDSRLSAEDRARLGDLGRAAGRLAWVAQAAAWLRVRDELTKFSKRVDAELEKRTPPKENPSGKDGGTTAEQPGEPGKPKTTWLTVSDAAKAAGCEPSYISRAVDAGALQSNGEKRLKRRIDAASLTLWQLQRVRSQDADESAEAIERKMKRAAGQ